MTVFIMKNLPFPLTMVFSFSHLNFLKSSSTISGRSSDGANEIVLRVVDVRFFFALDHFASDDVGLSSPVTKYLQRIH